MNPCDIKHADTSACSTALSSFLQPRFPHIPVSDYYPHFEAFLSTRRLSGLALPSVHYIITKACITPWSFSFHHYRRWETACPITHWTLPSCIPILWSDPPPSSSCNVTHSVPHVFVPALQQLVPRRLLICSHFPDPQPHWIPYISLWQFVLLQAHKYLPFDPVALHPKLLSP